jgi:hypothetical protein
MSPILLLTQYIMKRSKKWKLTMSPIDHYLSLIGRNSSSPMTKCVSSPSPAASSTSRHFFTMSADMSIMTSFSIPPDSGTREWSAHFQAEWERNPDGAVLTAATGSHEEVRKERRGQGSSPRPRRARRTAPAEPPRHSAEGNAFLQSSRRSTRFSATVSVSASVSPAAHAARSRCQRFRSRSKILTRPPPPPPSSRPSAAEEDERRRLGRRFLRRRRRRRRAAAAEEADIGSTGDAGGDPHGGAANELCVLKQATWAVLGRLLG